jgi:regulation of enolase protein 1 (concanavalin A-like superfamily)
MKQSVFSAVLLIATVLASFAPGKIGLFEKNTDVGNPKLTGSSVYNAGKKEYTLKGGGYNIWFERDEFQYLFRHISGDFTVTGDFELIGAGKDPHRKVGWMVRESLDDNASHLSAVVHGDGLTVLQWRVAKGDKMRDPEDEIFNNEKHAYTVQIERKGASYTMRVAAKGAPLQEVGSQVMNHLADNVMVGLFVCSHNADVIEEAKVRNVSIVQPKK